MSCYYHEDLEAVLICPGCGKRLCAGCVQAESGICWSCLHGTTDGVGRNTESSSRMRRNIRAYFISYVASLAAYVLILLPVLSFSELLSYVVLISVPIVLLIALPVSAFIEWFVEASITNRGYYRYAAELILNALVGWLVMSLLFGFAIGTLSLASCLFPSLFFSLRVLKEHSRALRLVSGIGFLLCPLVFAIWATIYP